MNNSRWYNVDNRNGHNIIVHETQEWKGRAHRWTHQPKCTPTCTLGLMHGKCTSLRGIAHAIDSVGHPYVPCCSDDVYCYVCGRTEDHH